ncbi:MAG: bifunctional phosphoglucose/phosphomannose isomerase [Caldiserica bacterium]|nr:bifunctional phosphoglucose/phosphomannose isomerase [Caldisericota bacterium]
MTDLIKDKISCFDKKGMEKLIREFPSQISWVENNLTITSFPYNDFNKIMISGLGGSAIAGDILAGYLRDECPYPIYVNRSYTIPEWVDEKTLTFLISYSGNTEETLSSFHKAREKKSQIIGISSDGELKKLCEGENIPFLEVPPGFPPRAALGYLFFSLLAALKILGVWSDSGEVKEVEEMLLALSREFSPEESDNLALHIAQGIKGSVPIIYSTSDYFYSVAMRWKTQINENAKNPCYWCVFPELDHNEIMGWEGVENGVFSIVLLMDEKEAPRMQKRIENTIKVIGEERIKVIKVYSRGKGLLARIFSLIYIGDWVSLYLGILNQVDPTEIKSIDKLKAMMKGA